jgi:hypothetical protein
MFTVILLTATITAMITLFLCLVIFVAGAMQAGYPDDSFRPAPGRKWPRITPRTFMAVIRGRA